jgi:hypothetical protein
VNGMKFRRWWLVERRYVWCSRAQVLCWLDAMLDMWICVAVQHFKVAGAVVA